MSFAIESQRVGVAPGTTTMQLGETDNGTERNPVLWTIYGILSTASMAASAYHGYKRNQSVGWALWWGLMGAMFPIITPTIALAQGYGEKTKK